ncbi:MAG: hypothetical protein ACKVUT_00695 [Gaiella sp.]
MAGQVAGNGSDAGISDDEVDVAELFRALREEVRRSGGDPGTLAGERADRVTLRAEAERLWPVSADRPLRLREGPRGALFIPVKWALRKLLRWYVEPVAYDQRSFNAALLRLLDEQEARLAELESELAGDTSRRS